jgi:glycosyltransferase involved in cell wall biosynthesis
MNATVSVVMATYNHARFVAQTIESVLSQRGVDVEFLIGDDGSTDGTREVVTAFNDPRIAFFPNAVNRGAALAINELIARARGEFVAIINSDDYWIDDEKLVRQAAILREDPRLAACFSRPVFVDKDGRTIEEAALSFGSVFHQGNRSQGRWLRHFFDTGNCLCHPTILIRRSCYDDVGRYDTRLAQLPDLDMWIRLVKRYPIRIEERATVAFRIRPGESASSQSAANSIRTINEHFLIASRFFEGVERDVFLDGFGDVLVHPELPRAEHIAIEQALQYFRFNDQGLMNAYRLIGISEMQRLLGSASHRAVLAADYAIDDRWFHTRLGEIDVLRPWLMAAAGDLFRRGWNTWLPKLDRAMRGRGK